MNSDGFLFFDDCQPQIGRAAEPFSSRGKPDDSGAHDHCIERLFDAGRRDHKISARSQHIRMWVRRSGSEAHC